MDEIITAAWDIVKRRDTLDTQALDEVIDVLHGALDEYDEDESVPEHDNLLNQYKAELFTENINDIRLEDLEEFIRTKNIRVNNVHNKQDTMERLPVTSDFVMDVIKSSEDFAKEHGVPFGYFQDCIVVNAIRETKNYFGVKSIQDKLGEHEEGLQ